MRRAARRCHSCPLAYRGSVGPRPSRRETRSGRSHEMASSCALGHQEAQPRARRPRCQDRSMHQQQAESRKASTRCSRERGGYPRDGGGKDDLEFGQRQSGRRTRGQSASARPRSSASSDRWGGSLRPAGSHRSARIARYLHPIRAMDKQTSRSAVPMCGSIPGSSWLTRSDGAMPPMSVT